MQQANTQEQTAHAPSQMIQYPGSQGWSLYSIPVRDTLGHRLRDQSTEATGYCAWYEVFNNFALFQMYTSCLGTIYCKTIYFSLNIFNTIKNQLIGLPWWLNGEGNHQCRRHGLIPDSGSSHNQHVHHNYWASAPGPQETLLLSPHAVAVEAPVPQNPCSTTIEATAMRSLHNATADSPHSLQLEKSLHSNEDPVQP